MGPHLRRARRRGVALVGLVIAHVYFAIRPEKWWITKSMIFGWVSRRNYLEHHDPARWKVRYGRSRVSTGSADLEEARAELNARCDAIEECYEFMLAYAGQGLDSEQSGGAGAPDPRVPHEMRGGAHRSGRVHHRFRQTA